MTDIYSLTRAEFDVLKATRLLAVLYPGAPASWYELHNLNKHGNNRSKVKSKSKRS